MHDIHMRPSAAVVPTWRVDDECKTRPTARCTDKREDVREAGNRMRKVSMMMRRVAVTACDEPRTLTHPPLLSCDSPDAWPCLDGSLLDLPVPHLLLLSPLPLLFHLLSPLSSVSGRSSPGTSSDCPSPGSR